MNTDIIRSFCHTLPDVTEGVKWGNDLCFMIGEKMFCVVSLTTPTQVSLKVTDEEFTELTEREGISAAPYLGRYKWIRVERMDVFSVKQWEHYIAQSYQLIKAKLPKKKR